MPIYEYSCAKCGETFEVIQSMSEPELKKHAGCGGAVTKLFSAAAFRFANATPKTSDAGMHPTEPIRIENTIKERERKKGTARVVNAGKGSAKASPGSTKNSRGKGK